MCQRKRDRVLGPPREKFDGEIEMKSYHGLQPG